MAQAANKKCEICMRASGLHYCSQCAQFFCDNCKMSHLRSTISRNHTFTTGSNIKVQTKSGGCKDHNEDFIYLCEECDQLICRLCVTKAHRKHAVVDIKDSNKKVQTEISRYLDSKVDNARSSANVIEGRTKTYKIDVDGTVNVIVEDGNRIKEMVDKKVGDLIKSLRERESIALQSLSKAHTECKDLLGKATRQQRIYQDMIKQCDEVALFHKMKKMKSDINNLKSVDVTSLPSATYNWKNVNFSDVEKLFGNLTFQLSGIASQQLADGDPGFTDFGDKNRPQKLGEKTVDVLQQVVKDVDMMDDHCMRAHLHGHFPDFPHHEGDPSMEDQDDSTRIILKLLWTHQDYFDQKPLSKAQAEYNYYRTIEKTWKKTLDRVTMEDIKHEKFKMEMFHHLPKQRPLYAVIATILEQSKEKKDAEGAAAEYYRMKVLEDTMIRQKMITAIPEGIDLDEGHFNELYSNMKARFKTSGRQVQMRQAAEFKMVPLFEYLKLKETVTQQRNQIEELASWLSGIASQQLADGDPGFTDIGDKNRPQKLGEKFAELFEESWASAYESLKPKNSEPNADEDEEMDEKTVNVLQQVIKIIYGFCQKIAQEQNTRIVEGMIPPIIDPLNVAGKSENKTAVEPAAEYVKNKTDQLAKQYRKVVAPATIKVLNKEILENELKGKLLTEPISKDVEKYVCQCIDLVWYMCIQQPPMVIMWAKHGEKFNREVFRFSGKKGKTFKLTVWPAVFLHEEGPLVAAGYAVPV